MLTHVQKLSKFYPLYSFFTPYTIFLHTIQKIAYFETFYTKMAFLDPLYKNGIFETTLQQNGTFKIALYQKNFIFETSYTKKTHF